MTYQTIDRTLSQLETDDKTGSTDRQITYSPGDPNTWKTIVFTTLLSSTEIFYDDRD